MKVTLVIFAIGLSLILSCNNNNNGTNPPTTAEDTSINTTDKILAAKPSFPGYFPTPYILGDTSYIRVICNRNVMEKVWFVYYDAEDHKWSTITWVGSGENNKIIGDTIFTRRNGLKGGHSTEDAPVFYMASSKDGGKTWEPQHAYEANYLCKNNKTKRSYFTSVLVSNDYTNPSGRPGAALIIQNKKQAIFNAHGIEANQNFDFLCPMTREF